jgi:predicted amidohydrolase YtcJ
LWIIVVNEKETPEGPQLGGKRVGRRGFVKVAIGIVGTVVAAAVGLVLLRKPSKQTSATLTPTTQTSLTTASVTPSEPGQTAQLVLVNGKIITVDSNDSIVQAVAVDAGKITKAGADEEIRAFIGDSTQVIDLRGRTVTPGLIDSHCHMGGGYPEKYHLDLRPGKVDSIAEIVRLVAKKVEETPKGEWVLGFGWFPAYWSESRQPSRLDLDPVSPDNPVFLTDMSGWYGWVNSYALKLSGVDENTPNPLGGIIDKDKTSNMPTGLLVNHSAMALVKKPFPSKEQLEEGILYASNLFLAEGVTRIEDNWVKGKDLLGAYQTLNGRGEPPTPTDIYYHINSEAEAETGLTALPSVKRGFGDRVSLKGWKLQVDGGAATAFTYAPHNGYAYSVASLDPETLKKIVSMLHKSGQQICIHVIGDRALDAALDAIEAALNENPRPDHRHRLEHVVVSPSKGALERIKKLGVVISTQPLFIYYSGDTWYRLFGEDRVQMSIPVKTAVDMGIPVALGSDYPCSPDTRPQLTLWSTVMRQTITGRVIGPQERVDIQQALRLLTMGSAYAAHEEDMRGSIEVGKNADFVVWSDDLYTIPTDKIRDAKAELTIIEGQIVHKASDTVIEVVPGSQYAKG